MITPWMLSREAICGNLLYCSGRRDSSEDHDGGTDSRQSLTGTGGPGDAIQRREQDRERDRD